MTDSQNRSELTGIINEHRKRGRMERARRGAAFVVAGGVQATQL